MGICKANRRSLTRREPQLNTDRTCRERVVSKAERMRERERVFRGEARISGFVSSILQKLGDGS